MIALSMTKDQVQRYKVNRSFLYEGIKVEERLVHFPYVSFVIWTTDRNDTLFYYHYDRYFKYKEEFDMVAINLSLDRARDLVEHTMSRMCGLSDWLVRRYLIDTSHS